MLNAQSNLVQAQNALYAIWVSYLTARMNLYLDLELMQLDDRGVWCDEQDSPEPTTLHDPYPPTEANGSPLPKPVGPADRK